MPTDLKSLTRDELEAWFQQRDQPAYRVSQLLNWLYPQRATRWEAMTNLPKPLRELLRQDFTLQTLELVRKQGARDTTQKFLWKLNDGAFIESVLIPANPALDGEASDRHTLCVSTQVGCAYGCKFCASGLDGWKRNLRVDEIVEQVLAVERWHGTNAEDEMRNTESDAAAFPHSALPTPRLINNLVIMGIAASRIQSCVKPQHSKVGGSESSRSTERKLLAGRRAFLAGRAGSRV